MESNKLLMKPASFKESLVFNQLMMNETLRVQLRFSAKDIFIQNKTLLYQDFYTESNFSYVPQKNSLNKHLNFNQTFQKDIIAASISIAHQNDESFLEIIKACESQLNDRNNRFSALMILASGSGHLASELIEKLSPYHFKQINHKIYGVDISPTMADASQKNFDKKSTGRKASITYSPVKGDCTSYSNLREVIPELSQKQPLLVISHGGARYFVKDREKELLKSFCQYPSGSSIIITEVGIENYELLNKLAILANAQPQLDRVVYPDQNTTHLYSFWNLTYYYFLMQQYDQLDPFRGLIDNFLKSEKIVSEINISNLDYLWQVSQALLAIAGTRKQPVYTLKMLCL